MRPVAPTLREAATPALSWWLALSLVLVGCGHVPSRPDAVPRGPEAARPRESRFPIGWPSPETLEPDSDSHPRLAIVIDDVGQSFQDIAPFVELPMSLTFAVLPFLDQAPQAAWMLAGLGREVLVHVPMEPCTAAWMDGPGFLLEDMDAAMLRATLDRHLDRVPGAVGANNHMGSRLTANREAMREFAQALRERRLYALDSRTTADTVLLESALDSGVPAARRHVFLDDDPSPTAVRERLDEAVRVAKALGCAVAIGHPRPTTYQALQEFAANPDAGVRFVPLSRLINAPCGRAEAPPKASSGR